MVYNCGKRVKNGAKSVFLPRISISYPTLLINKILLQYQKT